MQVKKVILWPDTHVPYEDKKAVALALRVGKAFFKDVPKKDRIVVIGGDFLDAYPISRFPKTRRAFFEEELSCARTLLDKIEGLGATRYHYVEGNHEARLTAYLAAQCSELFGLFPKLPQLLSLDSRWSWHPYHSLLKLGKAHISHDFGNSGPTAHVQAARKVGGNAIHFHTHWAGIHYQGTLKGSSHFGAALGCLADRSKVDYMNAAGVAHWSHAVGLGYLYDDGDFHLTVCPMVRGRATVEGREVR